MHGGHRIGAGRKKGFAAKNAEEIRKYLAQRVNEEIEPITRSLIAETKKGNIRALKELLDRSLGKPHQTISTGTEDVRLLLNW